MKRLFVFFLIFHITLPVISQVRRPTTIKKEQIEDAFVLNTNYEAMSHMIMEAMEAGTPVITSDIGGNRELIENGKTGLLAGYNDRQGFLSAAVKVLTDTEFAGKLAAAAKAEMKNFNWEDSFAKTIETIKETAR